MKRFGLCLLCFFGALVAGRAADAGATPFHSGVTIIIHGFQLGDNSSLKWVEEMGRSIAEREGIGPTGIYRLVLRAPEQMVQGDSRTAVAGTTPLMKLDIRDVRTSFTTLGATDTEADPSQLSKETGIVVLVDWRMFASFRLPLRDSCSAELTTSECDTGTIAGCVLNAVKRIPSLSTRPIHIIGHSRGASVASELALLLGQKDMATWVDHLTFLDPHPVSGLGWHDAAVVVPSNVRFADNYYRTTHEATSNPIGQEVKGCFNVLLSDEKATTLSTRPGWDKTSAVSTTPYKGAPQKSYPDGVVVEYIDHQKVHTFYHGTIDLSLGDTTAGIDGQKIQEWWYARHPRNRVGYALTQPELRQKHASEGLHEKPVSDSDPKASPSAGETGVTTNGILVRISAGRYHKAYRFVAKDQAEYEYWMCAAAQMAILDAWMASKDAGNQPKDANPSKKYSMPDFLKANPGMVPAYLTAVLTCPCGGQYWFDWSGKQPHILYCTIANHTGFQPVPRDASDTDPSRIRLNKKSTEEGPADTQARAPGPGSKSTSAGTIACKTNLGKYQKAWSLWRTSEGYDNPDRKNPSVKVAADKLSDFGISQCLVCPDGGVYDFGTADTPPSCSVHGN